MDARSNIEKGLKITPVLAKEQNSGLPSLFKKRLNQTLILFVSKIDLRVIYKFVYNQFPEMCPQQMFM